MTKKSKTPRMTKVVPVKMDEALYASLQAIADRVGENESTIIRIVLRAGLRQIVRDNYELFRFESLDPPPNVALLAAEEAAEHGFKAKKKKALP
jgi:hypothetical protein